MKYQDRSIWTRILFRPTILIILMASLFLPHQALATSGTLSKQWESALAPLATMPVQDSGFIRSATAFGQNHLNAIYGKTSYEGMPALNTVLFFMANPQVAASAPILKITLPELGRIFGGKMITLETARDEHYREALIELTQRDQKAAINALNNLEGKAQILEHLEDDFAIVPRTGIAGHAMGRGEWLSPAQVKDAKTALSQNDKEILRNWEALKDALRKDDATAGAVAAQALRQSVLASPAIIPQELRHLRLDALYMRYQPFAKSALFYLLATLAYAGGMIFARKRLFNIGYICLLLGFAAQVVGITARWLISERPPLSNMYESFTFAIGGMVLVALIFEVTHRIRLAGLGAGLLGFIFMVLALKAPIFDSKISPLMPALQSSWLTYHVITIMLSYSAFALSFFVSVFYLAKDSLGGDRTDSAFLRRLPSLDSLDIFNYKIIAVGYPLLTIGIILGAVWAATAWGRPWGFDPKETWSAITWLIYTVYLHARFIGGWKGRRAAILALLGFAAVLFTYLGVNYLLPGLHSYA